MIYNHVEIHSQNWMKYRFKKTVSIKEAMKSHKELTLKIKEMKKNDELMYEMFCDIHPIEAFHINNERFCNYFRKKTTLKLTNDEIYDFVKEMEIDNDINPD